MSKDDSKIIQGVAILLMLFLHLFNGKGITHIDPNNCIILYGKPLVYYLTRAANPVPFFCILSGYGLSFKYNHQKLSFRGQIIKVIKLLLSYWLSLCVFVGIGSVMHPEAYPGNIDKIVKNLITYDYSYNGETWFLAPYILLAIVSPWTIKTIHNLGTKWSLIITGIGYVFSASVIRRFGPFLFSNHWAYIPVLSILLLFSFTLGVWLYHYLPMLESIKVRNWLLIAFLILLIVLRCSINRGYSFPFYALFFIILFHAMNRPKWLDVFLLEVGKKSTMIWFIHTWFCYYLFSEWIYGFKYPLLIYLALFAVSYCLSMVCNVLLNRINSWAPLQTKER